MLMPRLRLLVATLWAGSLWAVGYLVAPTLSATLADRKLFGTIAGSMFNSQAWLSVGCAAAMLVRPSSRSITSRPALATRCSCSRKVTASVRS
mgnify:CR=1 FL=1